MIIWLPCKVSQLDTPFGPNAISQQLDSSACPRVVRLLHLQLVQAKEVLLNVVAIPPESMLWKESWLAGLVISNPQQWKERL